MGWLLTIWLTLPVIESDIEFKMWFSRERYCTFAHEKFLENPIKYSVVTGISQEVIVKGYECRKLRADEAGLIPEHMRK